MLDARGEYGLGLVGRLYDIVFLVGGGIGEGRVERGKEEGEYTSAGLSAHILLSGRLEGSKRVGDSWHWHWYFVHVQDEVWRGSMISVSFNFFFAVIAKLCCC